MESSSKPEQTPHALRERAARIRRYVQRYSPADVAAELESLAADLEARAAQMEAEQGR